MRRETKRTGLRWLRGIIRFSPGFALPLLVPSIAFAQTTGVGAGDRIEIVGTVTDRVTGNALSGVHVEIEDLDRSVFTNKDGRFVMRRVPHGTWHVRARQLGYAEWAGELAVGGESAHVIIVLETDPIMLEEIRVVADRIERRRRATAVAVSTYDANQLNGSAAFDASHFLRTRLPIVSCPFAFASGECVLRRGRPIVPRVYIDEISLFGGLEFLGLYNPNALYLIEVYDSGSQIRVYTKRFAERLALGQERVSPTFLF
jgi:hypothetical protein